MPSPRPEPRPARRASSLGSAVGAALAALLAPGDAAAQGEQQGDSAARRLAPVAVRATRAPAAVGGAGAVVVAVDSLRLPPAPSLEQALRELPFVLVRQNSRGESELSVRGSESRQAAVLLDGVPLTLGWDHRTDPSLVPLSGARRIVLVRGLSSLLHGPNVLGGVVEVGVAGGAAGDAPEGASGVFATGTDHLGGYGVGLSGVAPLVLGRGTLTARAGGGLRSRPGVARAAGAADDFGDDTDLRTNSDLLQHDGFLALRYEGAGGRHVGLLASAYGAERGVPPELHVAEPRLWRYPEASRVLAILSAGTGRVATALGRGGAEGSVAVSRGLVDIESYAAGDYAEVVGSETGDERTLAARVAAAHSAGGRGELRAAATAAEARYDERLDGGAPNRYRQRLWSVASEGEWRIGAATQLAGGLALDGADTPEAGDKPALGALSAWGGRLGVTTLAGGGAARLHASLSHRARFPSLRELYSGALGRFEPNPGLRPERLLGAEAGATARLGGVELQAVAFHHRLRDAIVRVATADRRFRRENRNEVRSSGVELLGGWGTPAGAALSGDLTLQRVRVHAAAAGGGARAEHQPAVLGRAGAALPLTFGLRAAGDVRYVGRQYCTSPDLGRSVALGGRGRADAALERTWSAAGRVRGAAFRSLRVLLALENVTDATVYDQCGLPQPGRTARIALELR